MIGLSVVNKRSPRINFERLEIRHRQAAFEPPDFDRASERADDGLSASECVAAGVGGHGAAVGFTKAIFL